MQQQEPTLYELEVGDGDIPGHALTGFDCRYPEAPDGGLDLILPAQCLRHARSVYWCLNAGILWCDGGPPEWRDHQWPE